MQISYRLIEPKDNKDLEAVIKTVMTEFGCVGTGYSIEDEEVLAMYDAYSDERSCYYVIELNGKVAGGGGISQLEGGDPSICELKKMYFYQELRGMGVGKTLMDMLLDKAKHLGYQQCYLETVERMSAANHLYHKYGFDKSDTQQGQTGHTGCDTFYSKYL